MRQSKAIDEQKRTVGLENNEFGVETFTNRE